MWTKFMLTVGALSLGLALSAAPRKHPLYEPEDPKGAAPAAHNLLLNAKVTASGQWDKNKPELAVDGKKDNPGVHWSAEDLPVWIQADMGKEQKVSSVRVWPYWGDGRIYKYKVEGSKDANAWTMLGDMTANSITATSDGNLFAFESQQLRYIRVTFLENTMGAKNGGHLVEMEAYADGSDKPYVVVVPHTQRVGRNEMLPQSAEPPLIQLTGWRGERVYAQAVICAPAGAKQVRVSLDAAGYKGEAKFLRYTEGKGKLYADIIDDATELDIPAGTVRPVWIAIDIPQEWNAGQLRDGAPSATLTVKTENEKFNVPIMIDVANAELPVPKDWKAHIDIWQHPDAVARYHDVPMWSDEHFALMKPIMQRLADAGQKAITAPLINEAWNQQTYDKFRSVITWIKKKDGTWTYDYSVFDKWVQFMMDCGITEYIHCYTMIPWSLEFQYYDEAQDCFRSPKLNPGSPEYEAHWGPFLKDLQEHVRAKGWLKKTRISMDERPDHLMRPALALVKKYAPEIQTTSAVNAPTKLTEDVSDISVIIGHWSSLEKVLPERKKKGYKSTIYVCVSPARPNNFTSSGLAEGTWLMHFSAAYEFDGFLRWAYMSWVENPLFCVDHTAFPPGDCFLVYPGNRGATRFETLRDGIEDYEKINILRAAAAKSNSLEAQNAIKSLNAYLREVYTWERGKNPMDYDKDIKETAKRINDAAAVILK